MTRQLSVKQEPTKKRKPSKEIDALTKAIRDCDIPVWEADQAAEAVFQQMLDGKTFVIKTR